MSFSSLKLACLSLLALVLAGCNVSSSKYNDTFTASSNYRSSSTLKTSSAFAPRTVLNRKTSRKKPYFIEFRARNALSYGHAFVVFGKLDRRGRVPVDSKGVLIPGKTEVAGLHPRTKSAAVFSAGHVVPVLAETGWSDGDSEDAYVLAKYRINLTKAEFRRVVAIVRARKRSSRMWHAVTNSCVTFIRAIANDMGLKTPSRPHLPEKFVRSLKRLNG